MFSASSARMPSVPKRRPSTPPASESSTLSVSSCRMMRPRPAPIAARTAISRLRPVARTSSRFATFAHAMSSTRPTAPSRIHSVVWTSRTISFCSSSTLNPLSRCSTLGYFRLYSFAASARRAWACCSVMPSFSRPFTWK